MQQQFHYQALPVNVFFSAGASKQTHRILKAPYFRKIALPATNPFSSHNIYYVKLMVTSSINYEI